MIAVNQDEIEFASSRLNSLIKNIGRSALKKRGVVHELLQCSGAICGSKST
jgi:hypothetical protein